MTNLWPRSRKPSPHGDPLRKSIAPHVETCKGIVHKPEPVHVYRITVSINKGPRKLSDLEITTGIQQWFETFDDTEQPRDACITFGYGVGRGYGLEHCVTVETATPFDVDRLTLFLLTWFDQRCAYITRDGVAWEGYYDKGERFPPSLKWSRITGEDV
jgi:hypothetical protein